MTTTDNTEARYETEHALRQDIHFRKGEILNLEYKNAALRRRIEKMQVVINESAQFASKSESEDLFEYIKEMIIRLSNEEGKMPVDPNEIDMKYVEDAIRYTMPGLFSIYALLSEYDLHRLELANNILDKFGIRTMVKYEDLVESGDIDVICIDRRDDDFLACRMDTAVGELNGTRIA